MEGRKLDIIVLSAKNLPDVRNFGIMKVYAEVSINGNSKTAKKSSVDYQNECNPVWNSTMTFTIAENLVRKDGAIAIVLKLYCERTFGENRYIGGVKIPITNLFASGPSAQNIEYPIDGTSNGILSISYEFGGRTRIDQNPRSGWDKTIDIVSPIGLRVLVSEISTLITGAIDNGVSASDVHSNDHSRVMLDSVDDGGADHWGSTSHFDSTDDHSHVMFDSTDDVWLDANDVWVDDFSIFDY